MTPLPGSPETETDTEPETESDDAFDEAEWDAAAALVERASDELAAGDLQAARATAAEAASRLAAVVGPEHPDVGNARVVAGDVAAALGQPAEAMAAYREALALYAPFEGDDADVVRPLRVGALTRLAYQLALAGHYDEAERLAREAVVEAERVHGPDSVELAEPWNGLGVCLRFAGRWPDAARAYARAGALRDAAGVPQPPTHFHNLSGLATARGDFAEAERHARDAIAAREGEPDDFGLGTDLCGLGDALSGLGRAEEAEAAYRQGLALYAAAGRADHPEVAFALHNLADALESQQRIAEAEASYRAALALKQRVLGADHHEVAPTLNNLAALLYENGRKAEGRELSAAAVALVRATLPAGHPVRTACETLMARLGD
ncbi:MAG: tetratricopeptide repeat protein [Myxococcota bacterium]